MSQAPERNGVSKLVLGVLTTLVAASVVGVIHIYARQEVVLAWKEETTERMNEHEKTIEQAKQLIYRYRGDPYEMDGDPAPRPWNHK